MEDVYTIKVKTKPDTRNLYPSERRYSASTVSGLAWVHIALAATSFLLACLALVSPNNDSTSTRNSTETTWNFTDNETNYTEKSNVTSKEHDFNFILVLAPTLITVFALAAGVANILASVKWYIDRNITWVFIMSLISTAVSLLAFIMIAVWFVWTSEDNISDFYRDKVPFKTLIIIKQEHVVTKNNSHLLIALNNEEVNEESGSFTKRVLSINILIAAFLEFLWSILSVTISYKGMKNNYKDDETERRGNTISVVTKIKGNDTRKMPRNGKLLPPKTDLIEHYPTKKMQRLFLAQEEGNFFKNGNNKAKNTDSSSEIYKERMISFLNRCASLEGQSNPEIHSPSVNSETALNTIPEVSSMDITSELKHSDHVSWGDTPDHTIYNQNTINFEKIFKSKKPENEND